MASSKYKPLKKEASDDLYEHEANQSKQLSLARTWKIIYTLLVLLAVATVCNITLFVHMRRTQALLDAQTYGEFSEANPPSDSWHDN